MSIETFTYIVSAIAVIDGLIVEALKQIVKTDVYNFIAGIVAVILSVCVAIGYALCVPVIVDAKYIVYFLCIALASWLSAMLGFDKVKQTLIQIGVR